MTKMGAARALGWTSLALGLTEILAPRQLGEGLGVGRHRGTFSALGAREMLAGLWILGSDHPAAGLWARVAGDAMDLAFLGVAASNSSKRKALGAAVATVAAITALDLLTARQFQHA